MGVHLPKERLDPKKRSLLWLEFVQDDLPKPWLAEHYRDIARCLGCFNGTYLAGKPLPQEPWLSRRWLRKYIEIAAPNIQDLPALRKAPSFQAAYAPLGDGFILEAWERREEFLSVLERLPQTLCHQDAFDGNLFWRRGAGGQGQVVGLDWAFTGIAAVGEELAPLVTMASIPMAGQHTSWMRFYEICLEGYLAGLADAGYTADPRLVRFSSLTTIFYRYFFGAALGEMWSVLRDERTHPMMAAAFNAPSVESFFHLMAANNLGLQEIYRASSQLLTQFATFWQQPKG